MAQLQLVDGIVGLGLIIMERSLVKGGNAVGRKVPPRHLAESIANAAIEVRVGGLDAELADHSARLTGQSGGTFRGDSNQQRENSVARSQRRDLAAGDAEELGVSKSNVEEQLKSPNPEIRRLLGVEGQFGQSIGLTNDWAYRVIKHIGNYGESFDRNVGQGSPLKIARGLNALWTKGGLQYGLPIR